MNNFNPLSNDNPPAVPTDMNSRDPLVNDMLGNAYHVVKEVYLRLGDLRGLYDFLNQYGLTTNIAIKAPVQAVTDKPTVLRGNQLLEWTASSGPQSVLATTGMRVLVMGQADSRDNGIYDVRDRAWTRSVDFVGTRAVVDGSLVFSIQGDVWQLEAPQFTVEVGFTPITFRDIDMFAHEAKRIAIEKAIIATEKAAEAEASAAAALLSETAAKQSETSAAASATTASQGATAAGMSANAAHADANRAEQFAQLAASGTHAYESQAAAQAAITAGTETNKFFYVISNIPGILQEQYQNVGGIATPMKRGMASNELINKLNQDTGVTMYDPFANVNDLYVVATGADAGSVKQQTSGNVTALSVFPVVPGHTYQVTSPDFRPDYFAIALATSGNVAVGPTLGQVALVGSGTTRSFSVPLSSTAKYAYVNVRVDSGSFDIRTTLKVNVTVIDQIGRLPIADYYARNDMLPASITKKTDQIGGQIYTEANNRTGYFVRALGANAGKIETASGVALSFVPVTPGSTYTVTAVNSISGGAATYDPQYFAVTLKEDNLVTGNTLGLVTLTGSAATRSFTVPAGSTAKFAFFNVIIPNGNWNIVPNLVVTGPADKVNTLLGTGLMDEGARYLISELAASVGSKSILTNKSWATIGDSITEKNFRSNKNYHDYVKESVGGMDVYNYGISGTGYYGRSGVAGTITQSPDYLTVFFGTNDWGQVNNSKPLGSFLDTTVATISGCINITLRDLVAKFYNKKIGVFTPLPRLNNWGSNAAPNAVGYTLEELCALIQKYCDHYSLPCLDLYHESNLPVWVPDANTYYFTAPNQPTPDGLHPNDAGHQIMARKIRIFLEAL